MSKLFRRPTPINLNELKARYEKFNLEENPFPSDPFVNAGSSDKRINGDIYEMAIRENEYKKIEQHFLKTPQSQPNHIRLGYIIEDSYVGRGNGKSAFLVNLQQLINEDYCLDISDGINKCFAIYVQPETGGRTKTFSSFTDQIFKSILRLEIIEDCLATLTLETINKLYPNFDIEAELLDEIKLKSNIKSEQWYEVNELDFKLINEEILKNEYLQTLPPEFPLIKERNTFFPKVTVQTNFETYYFNELKKGKERFDFLFSHLVQFFLSAGFNGAFVLVDDFEKIFDLQSLRQKKDFALELRSCLYDGTYTNAKVGFYNFLLVLHAGVQNIIEEAWGLSGMDHRAPISPKVESNHIIVFEKLSMNHTSLLIQKYLSEYRIDKNRNDGILPFTNDAVERIGEMSEQNASRILKTAYYLLEKATDEEGVTTIDRQFVNNNEGVINIESNKKSLNIEDVESENLLDKAK